MTGAPSPAAAALPTIRDAVPLDARNTFGFPATARHFAEAPDELTLLALLEHARTCSLDVFILGGGSNLVLTRDIDALVIHPTGQSIDEMPGERGTIVTADAGIDWDALVRHTLDRGLSGLENLALIPGSVGASPVQNIGAYGVELMERVHSVSALYRPTGELLTLGVAECGFAYRDSRFKRERDDWIITRVAFELGAHRKPVTGYRALSDALAAREPSFDSAGPHAARDIADAVTVLRRSKLPDPAVLGNAGSFFHNPIVSADEGRRLARAHADLVSWALPDGRVKLAAGWLIDSLGFRGLRRGPLGVHADQALVLVNEGGGRGADLIALVEEIRTAVRERYGVALTVEPRIV